jgi:hypothetical protein
MTQPSEERFPESADQPKTSARILPFERPPSDLQKAIQARAQEALERDRERAKIKPAPLRWAIMFLLALVPVILLVLGIDAFVRAFHKINDTYSKLPMPPAPEAQAPAEPPRQQQPGVVILESVPQETTAPTPPEAAEEKRAQ